MGIIIIFKWLMYSASFIDRKRSIRLPFAILDPRHYVQQAQINLPERYVRQEVTIDGRDGKVVVPERIAIKNGEYQNTLSIKSNAKSQNHKNHNYEGVGNNLNS